MVSPSADLHRKRAGDTSEKDKNGTTGVDKEGAGEVVPWSRGLGLECIGADVWNRRLLVRNRETFFPVGCLA